ncbi:MAG: efflux transporter outer membrane subunit [Sphingobacteriales bacterium]|nr:efflux transporter outer membrane subunit [Sphingobacteriales bacterium]
MNNKQILYGFGLFCFLLSISACKVTKTYQRPAFSSTDSLYRDQIGVSDTSNLATLPYQDLFTDPILQKLINEALQQNLDLKSALERMKNAAAQLRLSKVAYLPSLNLDLSVADNKQSEAALNFPPGININTKTALYKAQLSTAWEIDVWGKLGSAKRAALANFLQTDAAKRVVQTELIGNIANNYYLLLALDKQLAITQQTLQNRIKAEKTIKSLKDAAIVNGAAVVQSEANRYAVEVTIPDLKRSIRETENTLNILLARPAGSIERTNLDEEKSLENLKFGIPSQLLKNRPDVQAAEFAFQSAFENTNLARTYFYPSLTLTANGGLSSLSLKNFFDRSIFYSVIGGLTQPIFNKGLNKARLLSAKAAQQQAFYNFQKTLLTAGSEVSNQLFAFQTAKEKEGYRSQQIAALQKSVDYTYQLLKFSSATNYTDVLTSEQALLAAQLSSVNDQLQKLQAVVNLYKALGGGWQ